MAKLDRKDVKIFAEDCDNTLVAEFRTEDEVLGTASYSRDPDMIQNANYSQGWVEDTDNLNTKIYGEDLNAVNYVLSYLLKYLYENGIAEWKSTTTYYTNSITRVDDVLYISLIDDNTGNDPTNTVGCWRAVVLDTITSTIAGAGSDIVKGITGNQITFKSISVDGYASLTDNGDQLNIHVLGGGGIVDAFWGQIQGTLSNQTDLVSALGAKQDTITVDSPLSIDVNNEISIPKATTLVSGYLDYDDFNTFNGKQDALTGFTHTYDSDDDEATIEPSATTSNIGSNSYPITNLTANNITGTSVNTSNATVSTKLQVDTIARNNGTAITVDDTLKVDGNVYTNRLIAYDASTGYIEFEANQNKYRCESGKTHDFVMGTNTIASIGYLDSNNNGLYMHGDIRPYSNETYNIGTGGFRFNNFFIKQIGDGSHYTDTAFVNTVWTSTLMAKASSAGITLKNDLLGDSLTVASLGTTTYPISGLNVNTAKINTSLSVPKIIGTSATPNADSVNLQGRFHIYNGATHVLEFGYSQCIPATNNGYQLGNGGTDPHRFSNLWVTNINGSAYNPSDRDKKENINKRSDETKGKKTSLEVINSLETYTYNYKDDENKTIHIGIMAQDLSQEIPECVVDKGDNNAKGEHEKDLYIDVMGYVTVLTEAVKQLSAKVEFLEKEVAELKGQTK